MSSDSASKAGEKPDTQQDTKPAPAAKPAEQQAAKPPAPKPAEQAAKPAAPKPAPAKPAPKPAAKPTAKPAPAEQAELPEFEKGLADKIVEKFGEKAQVDFIKPDRIKVKVNSQHVHDVAEFVRNDLNFDHAESVSGVDLPADKEIEVVYHLGSYSDPSLSRQVLALATRAPREDNPMPGSDATRLPSLRDVFYSVEFHEREIFEMLGVYFEGHPDNRRLLLPEDWADMPPLRKDFAIKGR